MIALREISGTTGSSTLYYLHADHLGSTSLVTNASGGFVSRQSYYAYGAPRNQQGTLPTDKTFTSQRAESSSLGSLMDFNARFYSPLSGRFLSADTIVPGAGNPQALNRYMFVLGNPVKFTDPSGHAQTCEDVCSTPSPIYILREAEYDPETGRDIDQMLQDFIRANPSYDPWFDDELLPHEVTTYDIARFHYYAENPPQNLDFGGQALKLLSLSGAVFAQVGPGTDTIVNVGPSDVLKRAFDNDSDRF